MKSIDLKYNIIIGLLKLVAMLPLWVLYRISDFACLILHRVVGYRVKVVRKNLRNSFPEKTERELLDIENDFYRHLCDCFIEAVKLLHISDSQLRRRVRMDGLEILTANAAQGRSTILFLGHYGNWEWVPALTLDFPPTALLGDLYRPQHSVLMDRVMRRIRARFRSIGIPVDSAYRTILRLRDSGERLVIGFIADQRPLGGAIHHWTYFMGQPTAYVVGGETIGSRIGADYVYAAMEKVSRGHYVLRFRRMTPADEGPNPYSRRFLMMLEDTIRRAPAYWLWSHNRWKNTPPADVFQAR